MVDNNIFSSIFHKNNFIKFSIVAAIFLITFGIFQLFQNPDFYNKTLNKVAYTYQNDRNVIYEVEDPFMDLVPENMGYWDGILYDKIRTYYYDKGDCSYAFFPLFPMLWKISNIDITFIGLLNYFLFGLSVIVAASLFLDVTKISSTEKYCVFILTLILPTIVNYYLPYAEAVFTITLILALWGLIKNKYWIFFICMLLFATTRPAITIVAIAMIMLDFLYFLNHRNIKHFLKELSLKLLPILIGTGLVFVMFYANSGSLSKYFEAVNKYWGTSLQIPKTISDWSIEGYGMNIFTIFFVIFPSLILLIVHALKVIRSDKISVPQSIFKGDKEFIREYFFNNSIIHFWGVFMFILFYQGGSLNGLSRYIFASPFFYIFFFVLYNKQTEFKLSKLLIVMGPMLVGSLLLLLLSPKNLQPELTYSDTGYFAFIFSFIYLFTMKFMNNKFRVISLIILAVYNIIWITFLYNIFLCDGWIFT